MNARPAFLASLLLTAVALVLPATLVAQDTNNSVADKRAAARAAADARRASSEPLPSGVLASVNGRPIAELSLENVVRQLSADGETPDRERILDELIDLEILTQEAEKLGLDKKPEISAALQLQYTQTMANAYLAETGDAMAFSEEELRAEYDSQAANLDAQEYRASHILSETEADAAAIIAELDEGADFATLARERSIDPAGANGGDLGWFVPGTMVPQFTEAVASMKPGQYSEGPVKTDFGYHVILLVDSRGAAAPDFNSVKPGLTNVLLRNRLAEKVESLREEATIQR